MNWDLFNRDGTTNHGIGFVDNPVNRKIPGHFEEFEMQEIGEASSHFSVGTSCLCFLVLYDLYYSICQSGACKFRPAQ